MKLKQLLLGSIPSSGLVLLALQQQEIRDAAIRVAKKLVEKVQPLKVSDFKRKR